MSAAILLVNGRADAPDVSERFERVAGAFPSVTRGMERRDRVGNGVRAAIWSHSASRAATFASTPSGSWLTIVGNPTRRDLIHLNGAELLRRLLLEIEELGTSALESLSPPFAAVFHSAHESCTHVVVDRAGLQHIYSAESDGSTWISSSSLALGTVLGSEIDEMAVAEFVSVGHFVSQKTFFSGIRKLDCAEHLTLSDVKNESQGQAFPIIRPITREPIEEYIDVIRKSVAACSVETGLSAGLTGGLDSRVILAALIANQAEFLTWTVGDPYSAELRVIKRLAKRISFEHLALPMPTEFPSRLPDLVRTMHELQDGEVNALEYAPLLEAFDQLEGKVRCSISGVPGELFRGFYYRTLGSKSGRERIRGVPLAALLQSLTRTAGQHYRGLRRDRFVDPLRAVAEPVEEFLTKSPGTDPPSVVDDFYLRSRMQRFAGRQVTMTGFFMLQGLPYFANDVVDFAFSLPTRMKERDGYLPRIALARLSPTLASVRLGTGAAVRPASWKAPQRKLLADVALVRKGLARYGGRVGRAAAALPPASVSWSAVRENPSFREFVQDLLSAPDTVLSEYLEPAHISSTLRASLSGGPVYPLGTLVTTELTLRRARQLAV